MSIQELKLHILENNIKRFFSKEDSLDKMAVSNGPASSEPVSSNATQQKSPIRLDIIVVGAGISGLASAISSALSGHNVTVFESAKELLEVSKIIAHITAFPSQSRAIMSSRR